jgi:hypothetical protein
MAAYSDFSHNFLNVKVYCFCAFLSIIMILTFTNDCTNPIREEIKRDYFFGVWEQVDSTPWMKVYVFSDTIYQHYEYSTTEEMEKWSGDNFWKKWDVNGSHIEISMGNGGKYSHQFTIASDTIVIIDEIKFHKSNNWNRYYPNAL